MYYVDTLDRIVFDIKIEYFACVFVSPTFWLFLRCSETDIVFYDTAYGYVEKENN